MKGYVSMTNEEYHSSADISKSDLDAARRSGLHFKLKKEGPKQQLYTRPFPKISSC